MARILQGVSVLSVLLGGVMSLISNVVTLIPGIDLTEATRQYWGLFFLVLGIVLFMLGTFIDGLLQDAAQPRLSWGKVKTEYKPIHTQYILSNKEKITETNIHSELEFAYLEIMNNPVNPTKGQAAEKVRASLLFKPIDANEKVIEYGRWCDTDLPLLQPLGDAKSWKIVDIDAGSSEFLVVAFRRKNDKEVYAFNSTDHTRLATTEQLDQLRIERKLGIPPIEFRVKLSGKIKNKILDLVLDANDKGFVIHESKQ
jgi:hypothetical protein